MSNTITQEKVIQQFKEIHGNKYDYSLVNYVDNKSKIKIICPIHGEFEQIPNNHKRGYNCAKCAIFEKTIKLENFINRSNEIHNFKYDYSKVINNYKNTRTKVKIICKKHGEFEQLIEKHIIGQGCPYCNISYGYKRTSFIQFCNKNNKIPLVYIIRCFNNNEEFIKIGITTNTITKRFLGNKKLPYNYEVIKKIYDKPEIIWDLEKKLHKKYRSFKYKPLISFCGETECFNISILNKL